MFDTTSESLHDAMQRALGAGDFETVRRLSGALGAAIIREARAATPAERKALVQNGLAKLREHLSLARVLRAHVAGQLQANTTISLYQLDPGRVQSWRFDA